MDTELFKEWFQAFAQSAGITMHIENIYGDNSHHIIESCYKGLARSLRAALELDPKNKNTVPSTKGSYAYKVFNLPENAEMRFASLNVGSKSRGFSLTEIKNTELPSLDGIKMTTAVIQVEGLREIYKKIVKMNLNSTAIDEDLTPEGETFAEFSFTDYDGHLVVLYELK